MKNHIVNRELLFSFLAVLLMLFVFQGTSYGQPAISIDPVDSPGVGEQLVVNINITGATDVHGYQFRLTFDPTALSYVSVANADFLPAGAFVVPPVVAEDSVLFGVASLSGGASGDGTLATATFEVVEVKNSTIGLVETLLSGDVATGAIDHTSADGVVSGGATVVEPKDPETAPRVVIDRFSAEAGGLFVRDDTNGLPGAGEPIDFDQPPFITQGFGPAGQVINYYNFDIQNVQPPPIYPLFREGEENPVDGQIFIVDAIPGDPGYSDFWNVTPVTVPADYVANTVTSLAGIQEAGFAMGSTDAIVNCPIVPEGSTATLRLGSGDTSLHLGWYRDEVVTYFVFDEAPLTVQGGTVPVSPLFVSFNVNPGEEGGGPPSGFLTEPGTVQTHNVAATVPSDAGYSPLWSVNIYDNADFDAVSDLASAEAANLLVPGAALVNCPVVFVAEVTLADIVAYGYAMLDTAQEIPAPNVSGTPAGTAALRLDANNNLHFSLTVTGLSGPVGAAHFHGPAPASETAGVVFGITDTFTGNHAEGVWEGLTDEQLGFLNDGLLYLNVHTAANGPGEIRGQVHMGDNGVAHLSGGAEVPPVEASGAGTGAFKFITDAGGTALWYNITVTGLSGPIAAAHFHGPASEAENAGVIFGITDTFDGEHAAGMWEGLTDDQVQHLLDGQIYVNVHTEANPPGEIRGQVVGLASPPPPPPSPSPPPPPPSPPPPPVDATFAMTLDPGLNMISLPVMTEEPFTAQTFADALGATIVIQLNTASQEFVGFTSGEGGPGFPIEGGKGYIVNTPDGGSATFTGTAWDNQAAPGVNISGEAWAFVVSSNLQNAKPRTNYTVVAQNIRTGAIATDHVSTDGTRSAAVWADLSRNSVVEAGDVLEVTVINEDGNIVSGPFQRTVDITDIRQAYLRLPLIVGDVNPGQTRLAQNFPNPFNPETWMPFQLGETSFVAIQIHGVSGRLVRTIDLGMKPAGFYMTQSTAAHWDGRNSSGEHVASGLYFYTLETNDFAATRRMLISK